MSRHVRPRRRRMHPAKAVAGAFTLAALSVATLGSFLTPTALGGYAAPIQNTQDTVASGYFTCNQAMRMDSAYLSYSFDRLNGPTVTSSIPNLGNGPSGAGSYQSGSGDNPDKITPYTDSGPCRRDNGYINFLNPSNRKSSSFVNGPTSGFPAGLTSNNLTQEVWFRTASGYSSGGAIMSLSDKNFQRGDINQASDLPTSKDHQIFMDMSGYIHYVLWNGVATNIVSTAKLNDGNWHHVVATTSTTAGTVLWVDGVSVATAAQNVGSNSSNAGSTTYLHVGFDNLDGWAGAPTSSSSSTPNYLMYGFNGDIAYVGMYRKTFTPLNVYMHYHAGLTR